MNKVEYYKKRIRQLMPKSWLWSEELSRFRRLLCRFNASMHTDDDRQKMQYTLLRENHVIEKGMSMRQPRRGFGQTKVKALIERLSKYERLYGEQDADFLIYPLSTIRQYLLYMEKDGVEVKELKRAFAKLMAQAHVSDEALVTPAGISTESRERIQEEAKGDFKSLLLSRHSIRYFSDELPSQSLILQALELAARTPSACNRQAWHTHVYMGEDSHRLLDAQGGCNGFAHDVHCSIVVTADMKGFLDYEPFQCYVDGGLYAMNLINSLHYLGLGTIPLSCGFYRHKLENIMRKFDISQNEALIAIIGVGVLTDEVKIAESTRKPIETTNTFH